MTVANWILPNYTAQTPSEYKRNIDACFMVAERFSTMFLCHEANPVAMSVVVSAGFVWDGIELSDIAEQSINVAAADVTNPRIDRIVYDPISGVAEYVQGTAATTPVAPAFPTGTQPLCKINVSAGVTSITNANISDERVIAADPDPEIIEVSDDYEIKSIDMGKIIHIAGGPCKLYLPPLEEISDGQGIEIVSNTSASQTIEPDFGDLLDGSASYVRIPSFERMVIRRVTSGVQAHWIMTERPAYSVGQVIEQTFATGSVQNILGRGWLPVNGAAVSRDAYANLWAAYADADDNSPWGNGDGSSTMLIPDDRGRMTIAVGEGVGLLPRALGESGGEESHILLQAEMPNFTPPYVESNHGHALTPFLVGDDTSPAVRVALGFAGQTGLFLGISPQQFLSTVFTNITVHSGGSGQAHNNMQPFVVVHKFIKV